MITREDVVKVLDFGLAKGKVVTDSGPASEESPTLATSPPTMQGVILGTTRYLSPEQARGKPADRRTDIWSFGCILYECPRCSWRLAGIGRRVVVSACE